MYAVLRSEKTKFFSFGWCVIGISGAIIVPLFFLLTSNTPKLGEEEILSQLLRALYLGQLGIMVASAGYYGQDISHSALRTTLLTQPARIKLLSTKFINMSLIVVYTGFVSGVVSFIVLFIQHDMEWTATVLLRFLSSVSLGILSWIQIAWITSSLSVLTKSMIIPIAIMLPLLLGLDQMLLMISQWAKFLPTLATTNLFTLPTVNVYLDIWLGIVVQFTWAVILFILSAWFFISRSVR